MFKILLNLIVALAALPAFADQPQIVSKMVSGDRVILGLTDAAHSRLNFADCDYKQNQYANCKPVFEKFPGGFSIVNQGLERFNIVLREKLVLTSNLTQLGNLPEVQAKFADWKSDIGLQLRLFNNYALWLQSENEARATEVERDLGPDALARLPKLSNESLANLMQVSPQNLDVATDAQLAPSLQGVDLDTVKEALNLSVDQLAGISP